MKRRSSYVLLVAMAGAGAICAGACSGREVWPGPRAPAPAPPSVASSPEPPADVHLVNIEHPHGPHRRILLTPDRLAAVRGLRDAGAPSWRKLAARCDDDARETIDSGYEAWDWANAALDLALCHAVTARPEHASAALRYFKALLDDRYKVGDGGGGDAVVHHDDGYSIRTRGCFGAIAYDWLHDAPGMTPELRRHAVDRFVAWQSWFRESGYNREEPIANYYVGWFGAVAFGGIAADGDDSRAAAMLREAQRMYNDGIIPAYARKLAGGDFPEGWQYGDMVGAVLAIFADAETRPGVERSAIAALPWLHQSVAYRAHALWPDGKHMFDTGDWSEKPAVAPTHALLALAVALPPADEASRRARALAKLADDPNEEWRWLAAIADDPSRISDDPRTRGATSYLSRGTATVTARTDWSPGAVWVAFTSAPSLSDHQHLDAGHFEIVRGGEPLVVDAGGYGSYSSLSHNVIAVDDRKENDQYAPNQGTWSNAAQIARYDDQPRLVYALADYASAYDPAGYPKEHPQRSVTRAERELIFSRAPIPGAGAVSARVVVYDRVTLARPAFAATLLLHGGSAPEAAAGGAVRFAVGRSAAFVTTLLPGGAVPAFVHEPTALGDGPYYANDPPEGTTSTRVEVRSPAGDVERRFLQAIAVGPADMRPPAVSRVEGEGVDGVALDDEAYVFARSAPQLRPAAVSYRAPAAASRHVVASLAPSARYAVEAGRDGDRCRVTLEPRAEGRAASGAGVLVLELSRCALRN
jgi:hypothetical protein